MHVNILLLIILKKREMQFQNLWKNFLANIGPTRWEITQCESNINKKFIKSQTFIHRAVSFFALAVIITAAAYTRY